MFLKKIKSNTGILIRFDDIAPNMNWNMMDKCQELLNEFKIKPVLGVIPKNEDNDLLKYPVRQDFWETVKKWDNDGWAIAMHGYNHVYDKETRKKLKYFYRKKLKDNAFKIIEVTRIYQINDIPFLVSQEIENYTEKAFATLEKMDISEENKTNLKSFGTWLMKRTV